MDPRPQLLDIVLPVPLDRTFSYGHGRVAPGAVRAQAGDLVVVPFGRRREVIGLVVGAADLEAGRTRVEGADLKDTLRVLPPEYRITGDRLRLARWLAGYYALPLGEVVPLFHPPAPGTRIRGGVPQADTPFTLQDPTDIVLTPEQRRPVAAAVDLLDAGTYGALLLHGVTGSGKTEVYLSIIAEALARDRDAIYLLPEIALTPQTLARITARFGDQVAAIHSGLSAGERCRVHEAAARGEIKVVVGPRSALFAPLRRLGAIIVDEEHDNSYKQDEKPRYHARHAALVRGRENQAVVVLGSATPDLESVAGAESGLFALHRLPERVGAGGMPLVEIVDMRGSTALEGFTPVLTEALGQVLEDGRQALIYYNRRGFARVMQCSACGEAAECPNCDIGLTVHLRPRRLLCHYCGLTRPIPDVCPACGADSFLPSGGGTEKVELNLQAHFPEARILRFDHDTTRRRGSHQRILSAFAEGRADFLIGTQMIAKGHHFPAVALVGVLAADDGLVMPDFRAAERTFQLLTQVAGRSGRTGAGKVIFQTWKPEDPVIRAAAGHDQQAFLVQELPTRRELGYPPFQRLARVGLLGRKQGLVLEAATGLAAALRGQFAGPRLTVLGPAPAVFARLQDRFRFQILVKGRLTPKEKAWLASCCRGLKETYRGLDVFHDIDPTAMF